MKSTPAEMERVLVALGDTPVHLKTLAAEHSVQELASAPGSKAWTPQQILAHLRGCADVWTHSIYAMLAERTPVLPDINERKWAKAARYAEVPFDQALRAFTLQRDNLLRVLRALPPQNWECDALIFGRRHTVFTQARRMARHETEHSEQLETLLRPRLR